MFEAAQRILTGAVDNHVIHGFSLAIGRMDEPLFALCGGRLGGEGSPSVTPDTRYDLDSPTQMMVTAPLFLLALENGLLTLQDPISLYMDAPRDKASLTLLQLFTHTAGLSSGFLLEQEAENIQDAFLPCFASRSSCRRENAAGIPNWAFFFWAECWRMPIECLWTRQLKNIFSRL